MYENIILRLVSKGGHTFSFLHASSVELYSFNEFESILSEVTSCILTVLSALPNRRNEAEYFNYICRVLSRLEDKTCPITHKTTVSVR